jgi:DNA-binding NtrC family response regulator
VVDDEPLLRWSVAETLVQSGYEVVEAGDGHTAVRALFLRRVPDVVLLDLRLPDSGDLRVLAAMRRVAPAIPVILMSAFVTPEVTEAAFKLGARLILRKPFDMHELAPLIQNALPR